MARLMHCERPALGEKELASLTRIRAVNGLDGSNPKCSVEAMSGAGPRWSRPAPRFVSREGPGS